MADLLYLVITVAFFALTAGFVVVCDRIIGLDADHGDPQGTGEPDPVASADATEGAGRALLTTGGGR